ncbi:MAG: tRNA (adenosine(37)-N6)-threonylcarbamoyltransferase complex ATPase subunit type 1 TsaE [Paracoccaceae bacterium]
MPLSPPQLFAQSPEQTAALAGRLAGVLRAGDVLLLEGPVGAGKTHFARALIQAWLGQPEDVPSPSFTLVQTYARGNQTLWHTDLYRLTSPQEIDELGLFDAFESAICLVEWPDRLGNEAPTRHLRITFAQGVGDDLRDITLNPVGDWAHIAALVQND